MAHGAFAPTIAFVLSVLSFWPTHARPQSSDETAKALDLIATTADKICMRVHATGSSNSLKVDAEGRADLGRLLKALKAQFGVGAAVKYETEEFSGLLQTDVAQAMRDRNKCGLDVLNALAKKLLDKQVAQTKNASSSAKGAQGREKDSCKSGFHGPSNPIRESTAADVIANLAEVPNWYQAIKFNELYTNRSIGSNGWQGIVAGLPDRATKDRCTVQVNEVGSNTKLSVHLCTLGCELRRGDRFTVVGKLTGFEQGVISVLSRGPSISQTTEPVDGMPRRDRSEGSQTNDEMPAKTNTLAATPPSSCDSSVAIDGYRTAHSLDSQLLSNRLSPSDWSFAVDNGKRKKPAQVIAELNPGLRDLVAAFGRSKPVGAVAVIGAGGVGKTAVANSLKHAEGLVSIDLTNVRRDTERVYEEYVSRPGILIATLPTLSKSGFEKIGGVSGSEYFKQLAQRLHGSPIDWTTTRSIVLDNFDEVASSLQREMVERGLEWMRASSDRSLVVLGRGESLRPYAQEESLRFKIIEVKPLFVGADEPLLWFVGDFICWSEVETGTPRGAVLSEYIPTVEQCGDYRKLREHAKRVLGKVNLSPEAKEGMYMTRSANIVLELLLGKTEPVDIPSSYVEIVLDREREKHGRPSRGSGAREFDRYRQMLRDISRSRCPDAEADIGGLKGASVDVTRDDALRGSIAMREVLDLSGFVDIRPVAGLNDRYFFFPPVVRLWLSR